MEEKIKALRQQLETALGAVHSREELAELWQSYLGKKGAVAGLMKGLGAVSKEERPAAGKVINEFKVWAENKYQSLSAQIEAAELAARNKAEAVDITLPGVPRTTGGLHPITRIKNEIIDVFSGMGFEIFEGPEIEDDEHNFTRLNVPKNHPARDMQDTFYVAEDIVLRTQTSGGQIRVMDREKPPIKVLSPGRVFRSDSDATHSPMFHQMEGLVVDKGITLCDLQGMLDRFVQALFPVQAHRLDRGAGRRRGPPQRSGKLRHRSLRLFRLCLRHRSGAHRHAEIRHQQHRSDVRERPAVPRTVQGLRRGKP